ncbi:MAG: diguanylate cyclase [Armatimonadota bacterium]|nr:diguanylate cyclase [Armatimonadota bacterium]MDW8155719.1 diguanylate cyclase [Armatimonadota bacterium]
MHPWLSEGLGPGCRVEAAPFEDALELLRTDHYDLIVVDAGSCGRPVPEAIRTLRSFRQTPILLLAPRSLRETVAAALDAGADEFLFDDGPPSRELVRHAVEHAVLRRGMRDAAETDVDPSTGVLSPGAFRRLYEERRARSRLFGERFTVLVVQVLDVQRLQAAYGADALHGALQHTASALRGAVRSTDAVAHLGQGVLAALLDNGDRQRVQSITDRLHAEAQGYRPARYPGLQLRLRTAHATLEDDRDALAEATRQLSAADATPPGAHA